MMNLQDSFKVGSRLKYPTVSFLTNFNSWVHHLLKNSSLNNLLIENKQSQAIDEQNSQLLELQKANQRLEKELKDRSRVVTELRQLNKQMRLALEKEKKLNEHKSKLLSMASHELRTPLTTIMVSIDMLESYRKTLNWKQKTKFFNQIKVSTELMTDLMNEILQYNHLDAGQQKLKTAPLDLPRYCGDLLDEMRLIAGPDRPIDFSVQQETAETVYEVDAKVLRQILTNLLSNAIKYSPQGGNICFRLRLSSHEASFQIEDEGVGIPFNDQSGLFEVFTRGSNVGNIQGTGLGLAIVKKYIDLLGGSIKVESEVNKGSIFTVTLPLHRCSL